MEGIETVAQLMCISAVTAPKSKGENFVKTLVIRGPVIKELAEFMIRFGREKKKKDFDRDAKNVAASNAVVLIGIQDAKPLGLNCGACGFPDCQTLLNQPRATVEFTGPVCAFRLLDLGIALGSAVKTAAMLNVDNRIMYRVGAAAVGMKLVDWDYGMGIPLSVTGKSIFFDR
ncbi:MAG: DUF2148 domain-containing protein [Thermodesulfobacteriota bacterium]